MFIPLNRRKSFPHLVTVQMKARHKSWLESQAFIYSQPGIFFLSKICAHIIIQSRILDSFIITIVIIRANSVYNELYCDKLTIQLSDVR